MVGSSALSWDDDPIDEPARFERFGIHGQPPALHPAQDQQVLDESMQPLGFGAHVLE